MASTGTWSKPLAANGEIKDVISTFDDFNAYGAGVHITGMRLYIRRWANHTVIGGMTVTYSNGKAIKHGMTSGSSDEFHLDAGDAICRVDARCGWLVDRLQFTTKQGKVYGPYGGNDGNPVVLLPPGECTLSSIQGKVVQAENRSAITFLRFFWMQLSNDFPSCHSDDDHLIMDHEGFFGSLTEGKDTTVTAKAPDSRFSIDFCVGAAKDADIGLHLCFHMDKDLIFMNVKKDNKWLNFDNNGRDLPFYPGVTFQVKVYSFEKRTKIQINGSDFGEFEEKIAGRFVTYLRIEGLHDAQVDHTDR